MIRKIAIIFAALLTLGAPAATISTVANAATAESLVPGEQRRVTS